MQARLNLQNCGGQSDRGTYARKLESYMAPWEIYLSGALSKSSLRLAAGLCFSKFDQVSMIFTWDFATSWNWTLMNLIFHFDRTEVWEWRHLHWWMDRRNVESLGLAWKQRRYFATDVEYTSICLEVTLPAAGDVSHCCLLETSGWCEYLWICMNQQRMNYQKQKWPTSCLARQRPAWRGWTGAPEKDPDETWHGKLGRVDAWRNNWRDYYSIRLLALFRMVLREWTNALFKQHTADLLLCWQQSTSIP